MPKNKKTNEPADARKRKKMALGRGLDALIPDFEPLENRSKDFFLCDIELIHPNRYQPRQHFSKEELAELSRSIQEQGILQPLLVKPDAKSGYELIAGERRLRAAKMAKLSQVPVIVKDISETALLELSIIENIQREDLNPLEEADAYQRLMDEFDLTQEDISRRVGKSRPTVANLLRLRQLSEHIKESIRTGVLSMGHARALLAAENATQQRAAFREIVAKGLSVRQAEALIKRLNSEKKKSRPAEKNETDRYLDSLAEDLSRQFGTKVQIKRQGQKGTVEIAYYSNDDLDRLIGRLNRM